MAVALESLGGDRTFVPSLGETGKLLIFRGALQRADRIAYEIFREGQWSLPCSYLESPRRIIAVAEFDCIHPIRGELDILGEEVKSWSYVPGSDEMHALSVLTVIRGIHADLGTPSWQGRTPEETILGRYVFIQYDAETLEPIVQVKDSLPKSRPDRVAYCDSAGVPTAQPVKEYFALGSSEFHPR